MWEFLFVVTVAFFQEVLWTAWIMAVSKKRAWLSGLIASLIVYAGAFLVTEYVKDARLIHAIALATAAGAFVTTRFGGRG